MTKALKVGDKVRFTAKFLRSTGARGQDVWTVTGFELDGRWIVTDERTDDGTYRRIAAANVLKVGSPDRTGL